MISVFQALTSRGKLIPTPNSIVILLAVLDYDLIGSYLCHCRVVNLCFFFRYLEKAKELSVLFKDRPLSPLETAIYWIEYVIRHKGAHHLRSAAMDLHWFQYLLLDVVGAIILVPVIALVTIRKICKSAKTCRKVDLQGKKNQ